MSLSLGIVGLPNVGKSTLFNALTRNNVVAANYPFATIEPNEGVVPLPDARLATLAEMFASERIVPAPVTFVDIAGLVAGASEGAGLGNKFLANIRECDAICQVVRVFADDDVTHVAGRVDPKSDIEVVETELILADLQTLERAVPRLEKEARNNKERKPLYDAALAAQQVLDGGTTLFAAGADALLLRELNLLTTKPFLYAFNADESVLTDADRVAELRALVSPADAVFLDAKIEAELTELDDESAAELLESIGQTERGLDALARAGFHTLKLQTYLTAGPKESRAWTIHQGDTAPKAAGVIHTDFEKGFIKAEIVSYDDLVAAGSMAAAKSAGKVRMEGKDYVMADGDAVEFRFGAGLRRGGGPGAASKGSMGSYGSKRLAGRSLRACGSRRTSRGGRPRRSGSRGNLLRRGGSGASNSRVGRRRRARSRAGSTPSSSGGRPSSGGRSRRVRVDAGRLPVRRASDVVDRADRSTAWVRCDRDLAVLSTVSSAGSRLNIAVSLATNPSRPSSLAASAASVASAAAVWNLPRYHRIRPSTRTPTEVNSINGKRSING